MSKFAHEPLTATAHLWHDGAEAAIWYADGDMAASVHGNLGSWPEPIAALDLAQLMAAAPDMYEALRDCITSMGTDRNHLPAVQDAHAALAKADGGAA